MIQKSFKGLVYLTTAALFFWLVVLKIVARIAARLGHSSPCPASLAWLVDNPLRRRYMRPVLDWVGIKRGEQVLELGPGPGAFTIGAARQVGAGGRLFAVDIQPQMIAQVQRRVREAGLSNVDARVGGAYELPFEDGSIDRAFLISVLPEIPDPARALAELRRVLRPAGALSITAEFTDPDYLFVGETLRLLEENGFALQQKRGNWWRYTANFQPLAGWPPGMPDAISASSAAGRRSGPPGCKRKSNGAFYRLTFRKPQGDPGMSAERNAILYT